MIDEHGDESKKIIALDIAGTFSCFRQRFCNLIDADEISYLT